jgi:hypothetical protein
MTLIPDVYNKIGNILRIMRSNLSSGTVFTTAEVCRLYAQQYPADEEMMRQRKKSIPRAHGLDEYLNGQVYLYYRNPTGPAIEFLDKMSYRFV